MEAFRILEVVQLLCSGVCRRSGIHFFFFWRNWKILHVIMACLVIYRLKTSISSNLGILMFTRYE
jgi:hypothetical protein